MTVQSCTERFGVLGGKSVVYRCLAELVDEVSKLVILEVHELVGVRQLNWTGGVRQRGVWDTTGKRSTERNKEVSKQMARPDRQQGNFKLEMVLKVKSHYWLEELDMTTVSVLPVKKSESGTVPP